MGPPAPAVDLAVRVRDRDRSEKASVCDRVESWEHGTVLRCSRHPTFWEYNLVRVEDDPGMSAAELSAFADLALDGLGHRRIDFELVEAADERRSSFAAAGWKAMRLCWMRHESPPPPGPEFTVELVPYDEVIDLRRIWHREESPEDRGTEEYLVAAREVALTRSAQVLAVREQGSPIAFAQLEAFAGAAEVSQVFVRPEHRGGGLGTAITRAAILAAGQAELWITADDEDRPKELYRRLGFRPVWQSMEFWRVL